RAERVEAVHEGVEPGGERRGGRNVRAGVGARVQDCSRHVVVADPYRHERRQHLAGALQLGAPAEQEQLVGIGGGGRGLWRGVIRIEQLQHVCPGEGDVVQVRRDDRAPQGAQWGRRWAEPRRRVREDERDRRRAPIQVQARDVVDRSEEHTSELQSLAYLVCRLLLEKKKNIQVIVCINNAKYNQ